MRKICRIKATLVKKYQKVERKGEKGSKKVERAEKGKNGIDKMGEGWYNNQADPRGEQKSHKSWNT